MVAAVLPSLARTSPRLKALGLAVVALSTLGSCDAGYEVHGVVRGADCGAAAATAAPLDQVEVTVVDGGIARSPVHTGPDGRYEKFWAGSPCGAGDVRVRFAKPGYRPVEVRLDRDPRARRHGDRSGPRWELDVVLECESARGVSRAPMPRALLDDRPPST